MRGLKRCGCGGRCDCELVTCDECGKDFYQSGYAALAQFIMKYDKLACSYECNKALGQVS